MLENETKKRLATTYSYTFTINNIDVVQTKDNPIMQRTYALSRL